MDGTCSNTPSTEECTRHVEVYGLCVITHGSGLGGWTKPVQTHRPYGRVHWTYGSGIYKSDSVHRGDLGLLRLASGRVGRTCKWEDGPCGSGRKDMFEYLKSMCGRVKESTRSMRINGLNMWEWTWYYGNGLDRCQCTGFMKVDQIHKSRPGPWVQVVHGMDGSWTSDWVCGKRSVGWLVV